MNIENDNALDYRLNEIASKTIKEKRLKKGYSLEELANKLGNVITRQSLFRYENNEARMKNNIFKKICLALGESPQNVWNEINSRLLDFNNAEFVNLDEEVTKIPVLGRIPAGIPFEAIEDVIKYIDVPKEWTFGNKEYFGLLIDGNSMFPKYQNEDIVIFQKCEDHIKCNNKDCAVMVNGNDATFKKFIFNNNGVILQPYNSEYEIKSYSPNEVEELPIKVLGYAVQIRRDL